jgi:hypothetical protein
MNPTGRSIAAIVVGFFAIVILSIGTDVLMHQLGIFPRNGQGMTNRLFVLATGYRTLISIFGCYLAAKLAPSKPMKHAIWLGVIGIFFALIGVAVSWQHPELGPHWYPVALVVVALPCAWIGGKIRERQLESSKLAVSS